MPGRSQKDRSYILPAFDWAISLQPIRKREERLLYTRDQIFEEGLMDLPQIAGTNPSCRL
jgi:hypothetical protein